MTLGERVNLVTGDIGAEGGIIAVQRPGDPLDGLKIEVPEGAYGGARTFAVSYRPILATAFGEDPNFVSPLITIDNGGGYAEQIIPVTIPIQVPDDHFAMAFYCDESTGELEAIPVLEQTPTYVKIATCHFSDFTVSSAPRSQLVNFNLPTDFLPGRDDWQMPNLSSILTPLGNCAGMSVTAMWYFSERAQRGQTTLRGRYDNDLDALLYATPSFWLDDSRAIRLVSVAQKDMQSRFGQESIEDEVLATGREGPKRNFYSIALALYRTRKPQLIGLYGPSVLSHAVICYGIQGQSLLIADPNQPGDTGRRMDFNGITFEPYTPAQGTDAADVFDAVVFYGKTAVVRWDRVSEFWADFDGRTIGQTEFQTYSYQAKEFGDNPDEPGEVVREFEIDLTRPNYVSHHGVSVDFIVPYDKVRRELRLVRFDELGPNPSLSRSSYLDLKPGVNIVGFYLCGTGIDFGLGMWPFEAWHGFDWITFVYEDPSQPSEPSSPAVDLSLLKSCTITLSVQGHFREPQSEEWQPIGEYYDYDAPVYEQWFGTGSFEGSTFTAIWTDRVVPPSSSSESGMLRVTIQPETLLVTRFAAMRTETNGANVTTSVVNGGDVRMVAYGAPPIAGLECMAVGDDVSSRVTEFEYQVTRGPDEWLTVVPWTELTSWDCYDIAAGIQIVFKAN